MVLKIMWFMVDMITFIHTLAIFHLIVWTADPSTRLIIGFSIISEFQVRLPSGDEYTSVLNMIIVIRDNFDCITEWTMSPIIVSTDKKPLMTFIKDLHDSQEDSNMNELIRLVASGNQNTMAQIVTSISQEFNKMNMKNLHDALSSKYLFLTYVR